MNIKLFKVDYRVPDDENKLARHGKSQSLKKQPKCINFVCVCVYKMYGAQSFLPNNTVYSCV